MPGDPLAGDGPVRADGAGAARAPLPSGIHPVAGPARGRLGTQIWRVRCAGGITGYLKVAPVDSHDDLAAECARLRWLRGRLPVPEVLGHAELGGRAYLLLSELPGVPAHRAAQLAAEQRVERFAEGLRQIHALPHRAAFDATPERELARARHLLRAGCVDRDALQRAAGEPAEAVLDRVAAAVRPVAAPVFTHGDYCLPNVLVGREVATGFVDWGMAGTGDPHRDLALAIDSVRDNLGDRCAGRFVDCYGRDAVDPERLQFHRLLDLFFTHLDGSRPR